MKLIGKPQWFRVRYQSERLDMVYLKMTKKVNQRLYPRLSTFMPGGKVIVDLGCGAGEALDELSQL